MRCTPTPTFILKVSFNRAITIMNHRILGTTAACLLICSCTSTPVQKEAADASGKPDSRLASMASAALEGDAAAQERSGLLQKIQELGKEVAELRSRVQNKSGVAAGEVATTTETDAESAKPAVVATTKPVAVPRTKASIAAARRAVASATGKPGRETILIQENGMVFRVMHGFAKTDFHPSKSLQQQLLQAARAGKQIDIRGRTDAATPNEIDREIAMERALNARVFLANNGIHPRKMRINALAAGDNVADNSTADGRARNRRVEIETSGISRDVLEDMAAVIRQDLQ
jgi:flagellar motor protein MotB